MKQSQDPLSHITEKPSRLNIGKIRDHNRLRTRVHGEPQPEMENIMISQTQKKHTNRSEISGCIRKMSICERMFFMSPACTVMMAARIGGPLDETRLRQALDTLTGIHPFLRAKISFDHHHEAYFSSEDVPQIPLRIIPRVSDHQWLDEIKNEARIPFVFDKGPLIKCVLLHSPGVSDLLVLCNHSICDGMALAIFIRDLLVLYENPNQKIASVHPPDVMKVLKPGLSVQGLIGRIIAGYVHLKWRNGPYYFGSEDYSALYSSYWEDRKPGIVLFEFDPDESERLLALCRSQGISVGSALSVACLFAYEDITGGFLKSKQKVMVPFDLRRRAHVGDVFSLCVGSLHFPVKYSNKMTFWQKAVLFHQETHSRLNTKKLPGISIPPFDPSFMDAIASYSAFINLIPQGYTLTEKLRKFREDSNNVVFSRSKNFENSIPCLVPTNLGRIDIPESLEEIRLERLVFLPSSSEINPLILGGVAAGGRIVFSLQFVDPPAKTGISPEPEMIRIRNLALELLGFPEKVHPRAVE